MRIEEHEHEDVRLFDHVVPVDAIVGPVRIEGEIGHGDRVDVDVGKVEEPLMLLEELCRWVIEDLHAGGSLRGFRFDVLDVGIFLENGRVLVDGILEQTKQIVEALLGHEIGIGVVVHHNLEFIRAHDPVEAKLRTVLVVLASRQKEFRDLDEHFKAVSDHEFLIVVEVHVMGDGVSDSGSRLELGRGMLPKVAGFFAVARRDREASPFAIEFLGPFFRFFQRVITEKKQVLRGFLVREKVIREAIGLGIPESVSGIRLAR